MRFYPGEFYHIYNRGNLHQKVFFERKNYLFFLRKMEKHLSKYCHMLAWCLMPNHFHWLVKVKEHNELNSTLSSDAFFSADESHKERFRFIQNQSPKGNTSNTEPITDLNKNIGVLLRSYTRAINVAYKSKGSLFQQGTKSKNVNKGLTIRDDYALICFLYILQNPVKAGLVKEYQDWEFSSYQDYAGTRNGRLCNKKMAVELFDLPTSKNDFLEFIYQTLPDHYQDYIF